MLTNLYYERHVYVYDLVTSAGARLKRCGQALLEHVEDVARREGCKYVVQDCGQEREDTLRFYERLGFERPGYSIRKALG